MKLIYHPCIIYYYQNNNTKEIEFVKLMHLINKQIYGSDDITHTIGIFCVHHYYSHEIARYTRNGCDSDNMWYRDQFHAINEINKIKLIEYFQNIVELKRMLSNKSSSIPEYLQEYLNHLENINDGSKNKIQNVSKYAEIYLDHFKLKLIDFCISKTHKKLIELYEKILFRIKSGFWKSAYTWWRDELRYIVVDGHNNRNKQFISLLPYTNNIL